MAIWRWLVALAAVLAFAGAAQAQPARRVALVIGNGAYASAGALANTRNDATLVGAALRQVGFTTITMRTDLSTQAFQKALREFQSLADGADVALIYYAGHGIEARGVNWLIPIDATLADERALPYEAIDTNLALEAVAGARVRILLLDACRDNPFGRAWRAGTRSVSRGLVRVEADDVLVVFAAAPGERASDGSGTNSPFAQAVARALPKPGVPVQLLGGVIRDDVMSATGQQQRPFVSASMTGQPFFLVGEASAASTPATAPGPAAAAENPELNNWKSAERLNTAAAYQAYLAQYPDGAYAAMAKAAIATLQGPPQQVATARPSGPLLAAKGRPRLGAASGGGGLPAGAKPFDHYLAARGMLDRGDRAGALRELFLALRGWPPLPWAPDAAATAALTLAEDKRASEACMVLGELDKRYAERPPGVTQRADHARKLAGGCGT